MNPRLVDMTWIQFFWHNQVAAWSVMLIELAVVSAASAVFLAVRARLRRRREAENAVPVGLIIDGGALRYSCKRPRPPWANHNRKRRRRS